MTVNILSPGSRLEPVEGAITLLVVEDNDLDAERLFHHLRRDTKTRWRVHWARSLAEGLNLVSGRRFDAALIDLQLPDAAGLEVVRAVVAADPSCPVVVQSEINDEALASNALANGAQDYLYKPVITAGALARSINHAITRHSLRVTQAALRETHDELDDFAHVVAHDLRAPVRTARLLADRLVAGLGALPEPTADLGFRLDQALGRLDRMVLGMLEYSGLRALDVQLASVPLLELVNEVVDDIEADGTHVDLDVRVDINSTIEVLANRDMLVRVFINLLTNSIKFARPETPLSVTVAARVDAAAVVVTVADNGIGLPEGTHEKVFGLTERLTHDREGLGFGLAIVRRCIAKMDGSIRFDPLAVDGATAILELRPVPGGRSSAADDQPVELSMDSERSTSAVSGL